MQAKKDRIAIPADPNDPEDFDVSEEGLQMGLDARDIRQTRQRLRLTQEAFAQKFRIPVGTLRDWEQVRAKPPAYALAYLRVIAADPELVEKSVA